MNINTEGTTTCVLNAGTSLVQGILAKTKGFTCSWWKILRSHDEESEAGEIIDYNGKKPKSDVQLSLHRMSGEMNQALFNCKGNVGDRN